MLTLQISTPFGAWAGRGPVIRGRLPGGLHIEIEASGRRSPAPDPQQLATGLERPICDGVSIRRPALAAVEADRAFAAGWFYLPGQIIDRSA